MSGIQDPSATPYEALLQFLYQAPIGLVQTTLDGEIIMINPMSAQLLMPLAPSGNLLNLFDTLAAVAPQLRDLAASFAEPSGTLCDAMRITVPPRANAKGDAVSTVLSIRLVKLDQTTLMASVSDVTFSALREQARLASEVHNASRIDSLTAMPNRTVALERLSIALACARRDPTYQFAVLFVNGDRFSRVNVTWGMASGDDLLRLMAARLLSTLRARSETAQPMQTLARLGGDEFVLVLEGLTRSEDVLGIAHRVVQSMSLPYTIAGAQVHAPVSVGIALRDHVVGDAESVLQDASLAMREAKRAGGARYQVFEPVMKELAQRRGSLEGELRHGLQAGELFVVYQPIVDLTDGSATGVEALVRWRHPVRGIVSPIEFIGIAEETGLIGALGKFVLNQACREFVRWQQRLGPQAPQTLSVNLSRAQLEDPAIVQMVSEALQSSGLAVVHLQLEVTESLAAQGEHVQNRLHELKALGLALALDDFGTGYSSLATLHLLPVDVVKIDRSFVSQSETSAHHRVLIEATIRVARSLGMRTVAEGVETEGQAAVLATLQCDKVQGYLYARPLEADAAADWLAAHRPRPLDVPATRVTPTGKLLECLERSHIALALFDPQERLAYANRSFLSAYWDGLDGMPTWDQIMRRSHQRKRGVRIDSDDIDSWLANVRLRYRQEAHRTFESDMADGRWMRVNEETREDGWQLTVSTDVTGLKAHEADLRRAHDVALMASITDPLTGLPNRRFVFDRLAELMSEAFELRIPLTLVAIDLDEFKSINDTHGHAVGDRVLQWFAQRLAATVRQRDAVGRIGGEEFLLVLANTECQGAQRVLRELRSALFEAPLLLQSESLRIGFSAGVAEAEVGEKADALCLRADQALYRAKAAGRNQDCFVEARNTAGKASLRKQRQEQKPSDI